MDISFCVRRRVFLDAVSVPGLESTLSPLLFIVLISLLELTSLNGPSFDYRVGGFIGAFVKIPIITTTCKALITRTGINSLANENDIRRYYLEG